MDSKEELSLQIYRTLRSMLEDFKDGSRDRLYPEEELVARLGVSRSVVRDALGLLESQGFITRKRGVGTVINHPVLKKEARLDLENDFLELLASAGLEGTIGEVEVRRILEDGESYLLVRKLVSAGGQPAILVEDRIPERNIHTPWGEGDLREPIYSFLRRCCHRQPAVVMLDLKPRTGGNPSGRILGLTPEDAYLEVTETGYDLQQNVVIRSRLCYRSDLFDFSILRKELISHVR